MSKPVGFPTKNMMKQRHLSIGWVLVVLMLAPLAGCLSGRPTTSTYTEPLEVQESPCSRVFVDGAIHDQHHGERRRASVPIDRLRINPRDGASYRSRHGGDDDGGIFSNKPNLTNSQRMRSSSWPTPLQKTTGPQPKGSGSSTLQQRRGRTTTSLKPSSMNSHWPIASMKTGCTPLDIRWAPCSPTKLHASSTPICRRCVLCRNHARRS